MTLVLILSFLLGNLCGADVETNERLENNNEGCWQDKIANITACKDTFRGRVCECPLVDGVQFKGDGYLQCEDVDKCRERKACQCPECKCKNTWGSYDCSCSGDLLYMKDHDTCISKTGTEVRSARAAFWVILIGLAMAGGGGYLIYKYRLRSYMDSEIRAIMAQYMPLDSQSEVPNHVHVEHA